MHVYIVHALLGLCVTKISNSGEVQHQMLARKGDTRKTLDSTTMLPSPQYHISDMRKLIIEYMQILASAL